MKTNGDAKPTTVMTTLELAQYLRVHPSTIYKLLRQRKIPAFKIGTDYRFNVEQIDQWMTFGSVKV
jgi:excisionase family DNA binding protein